MRTPPWTPLALFFFSGACVLADEVLWARAYGVALGATHTAEALVLAAFFAAAALGAWIGGAWAGVARAQAWRRYALCEAAIALGAPLPALVAPRLAEAPDAVAWPGALAFLVLPVVALGASWPVMVALAAPSGRAVGRLYAVTTAGGTTGALVASFVGIEALGVRGASFLSAGCSAALAACALLLARAEAVAGAPASPLAAPPSRLRSPVGLRPWLLGGVGGALALALEVLGARLLATRLPHTAYSFGVVLATQLAAMAAGGALAARWLRRPRVAQVRAALLPAAGGALLLLGPLLARDVPIASPAGLGSELLRALGEATVCVGAPALLWGSLFPSASALLARAVGERRAPRLLGRLAALNALCGLGGLVVAHFVLLPACGLGGAFAALSAGGLLLSVAAGAPWGRAALLAAVTAAVAVGAVGYEGTFLRPGERVVAARTGPAANVALVEGPQGNLRLVANGRYTLGDSASWHFHRRLGWLPALLAPGPRRKALVVGLATGMTAAGLRQGLEASGAGRGRPQVVAVELLPEVLPLARRFARWHRGPLPPVVTGDGRRALARAGPLDLVVYDLFLPWRPGTANLFTLEAFRSAQRAVGEGGAVAVWLPLHQLSPRGTLWILDTFAAAQPQGRVYAGRLEADRQALLLLGGRAPRAEVRRRWQQARARGVLLDDPVAEIPPDALELGTLDAVRTALVRAFALSGGRILRDDRPALEFVGARERARGALFDAGRFRRLVSACDRGRGERGGPRPSGAARALRAAWAAPGGALEALRGAIRDPEGQRLAFRIALREADRARGTGYPLRAARLLALAMQALPAERRWGIAREALRLLRSDPAPDTLREVLDLVPAEGAAEEEQAQALAVEAAQLYLSARRPADARRWVLRLPPTHPARAPLLVLALWGQGRRDEARTVYRNAEARRPGATRAVLERLGAWERIRAEFEAR